MSLVRIELSVPDHASHWTLEKYRRKGIHSLSPQTPCAFVGESLDVREQGLDHIAELTPGPALGIEEEDAVELIEGDFTTEDPLIAEGEIREVKMWPG